MATPVRCQNPACSLPDGMFEPTRKNNLYHSPACRQAALRNRQKESQETLLDQRLRTLPISVTSMIKALSEDYSVDAAMQALNAVNMLLHLADAWPKEVRDLVRPDQQKIADLEAELARYRQICDLSDRKKLEERFMALGAAFGHQRLINYNVQPGEEQWRTFLLDADDTTLAEALVHTEVFYRNWTYFVEATDLKKAERRIAELEQTIERYVIADQKAKEAITELQYDTSRGSARIDSLEQELAQANRTIERYEETRDEINDAIEQRWLDLRQDFMALGEQRSYQPMRLMHLRKIHPGIIENIGKGKDRWEWAAESLDPGALMVVLTSAMSEGAQIESSEERQASATRQRDLERQIKESCEARKQAESVLDQMQRRVKALEQELEEERAKFRALLDDFMQAGKKIGNLERHVQRFARMKILKSRESMLQELMLLGGRLKYACLTDLGIGEGIDTWLDYIRGLSDADLSKAIAHGYWQADSLAMAIIDASDEKVNLAMRQRIDALERDVALRDARIAELEHGTGEGWQSGDTLSPEQVQSLVYHAREQQSIMERQAQQIEDLEDKVRQKITKIHRLEESHGSTMFTMNSLLAAAQLTQREEGADENQMLCSRVKALEEERAEWMAWKEAEIAGHGSLTAMRQYLQDYLGESIPVKRNGVTLKIVALGEDAVAVSEGHGIIRLNDDELEQGRVWVARKQGVPVIATRLPIGKELEAELMRDQSQASRPPS